MARPVEYDLQKVLDSAMELFWQKGYENVSMADLVAYTGLNRRTMYSLFTDKEGLFKDTLDNYYSKRSANAFRILKNNSGKKGIEMFLQIFSFSENFKGCFFNNCIGKDEFMKEEAFDIPKDYFINLRFQLEKNLEEASIDGDFSGDVSSVALTIITILHGFNVHGKYNHSKEDGEKIMNTVIGLIR